MIFKPEDIATATAFKSGTTLPEEAIYDAPEFLGAGCYGYAFDINERVFKVTTSISEAIYALKFKSLQLDQDSQIAEIHDVYLFENEGSMYFIIEQERIEQNEDLISEVFSLLSDADADYTYDMDDIEEALKEQSIPLSQENKSLISSLQSLYFEMTLNGFFNVDLHQENLGFKNGKICCFDQMDTNYEKILEDDYLKKRDIFSILERNCSGVNLSKLKRIHSNDVVLTQYIEEIAEFCNDLKFAFSTDEAYSYLVDGDWGAGGCYEYATIGLEMLNTFLNNESLSNVIEKPMLGSVINTTTGNTEHYYIALGSLCIDSDGLHNKTCYIDDVVDNFPHLGNVELKLEAITQGTLREDISLVEFQKLKDVIQENTFMDEDLSSSMSV